MKRRGAFPHTITVNHRGVTSTNSRNNEVRGTTSTIDDLPASAHPVEDTENTEDRSRSTLLLEVETLPTWAGADVTIAAEDTIVWNGNVYELIGAAELETDHLGRRDHLKFTARKIVG